MKLLGGLWLVGGSGNIKGIEEMQSMILVDRMYEKVRIERGIYDT